MSNEPDLLHRALGETGVPEAFDMLSPEEKARLAASVEGLRKHQERELERAVEEALSHIPGLLRKSVRKILFS